MSDLNEILYIPIGCDCSIAYQLQKHGMRVTAFPFDWCRMNSLDDLSSIIKTKFQFFFDKDHIVMDREATNFPFIEDNWIDELSTNIVLKHTLYGITFPHDMKKNVEKDVEKDVEFDTIIEKYKRRILRFDEVCKNDKIKKVFIRVTAKKECVDDIDVIFREYAVNYKIRLMYFDKKTKYETWKKDEYDWISFFSM